MKKTRMSIACLLAATMLSCTFSLPTAYAADETVPDGIMVDNNNGYVILDFGSLDDAILKTYGENAVVKKPEQTFGGYNQIAYVLTEDCRIHLITVGSTRIVTMKDGTYPPVQKIKEEMDSQYPYRQTYFAQLPFWDENKYIIIFPSDSPANDILLNDENVVSIEETNVIEEFHYSNLLGCVVFECINGITYDEFYEEYKDSLHLVYPQEINGYTDDGFYGMIDDSPETYEALKKLFESDIDFFVCQISPVYYPGTKEYNEIEERRKLREEYNKLLEETEQDVSLNAQLLLNSFNNQTPDSDIGDLNTDGSIDLTDLSELALAVIGEIELTDSQKSAADINGDGEVNVSDLARLKQFVSNSITSLR